MALYSINNAKRVAAFLAHCAVESEQLNLFREHYNKGKLTKVPGIAKPAYNAKDKDDYFEYWYGGRAGNKDKGDGAKYYGRGAIQITGKETYRAIGAAIAKDLVTSPNIVETDPATAIQVSAYYFGRFKVGLLSIADSVDAASEASVKKVNALLTHLINGGNNKLAERLAFYRKALNVLGA